MIKTILDGKFMEARDMLREIMVLQGISGEDMVTQIYQELSRLAMEGEVDGERYIGLIDAIGEYDFRIREGANPRIQLEALLARFLEHT